jgi:hypothetical protein
MDSHSNSYGLATVNAIQGDKQETYRWLQSAVEDRPSDVIRAPRDPLFEDFYGDERFQKLVSDAELSLVGMLKQVRELEPEFEQYLSY